MCSEVIAMTHCMHMHRRAFVKFTVLILCSDISVIVRTSLYPFFVNPAYHKNTREILEVFDVVYDRHSFLFGTFVQPCFDFGMCSNPLVELFQFRILIKAGYNLRSQHVRKFTEYSEQCYIGNGYLK